MWIVKQEIRLDDLKYGRGSKKNYAFIFRKNLNDYFNPHYLIYCLNQVTFYCSHFIQEH